MKHIKPLNIVLVLIGGAIIFLGLNIGLGGMRTLGWQSTQDFLAITDVNAFHIQDNHIRFIGGIWFGVGAMFLMGGFALAKMRQTLILLSIFIAVAGLFRISAADTDILFSAAIAPSMVFELIGFPLLAWWLSRSGKQT